MLGNSGGYQRVLRGKLWYYVMVIYYGLRQWHLELGIPANRLFWAEGNKASKGIGRSSSGMGIPISKWLLASHSGQGKQHQSKELEASDSDA